MRQMARQFGAVGALVLLGLVLLAAGCSDQKRSKAQTPPPRYPTIGPRENIPEFMKGTVYEMADLANDQPYLVGSYGLVVNLSGPTGNNNGAPLPVRDYIRDEMVRHGFGSVVEGLGNLKPEQVINDPRTAIVEVYGFIPVGARAGDRVDIYVQAVTGSQTTSLAGGTLYLTDLYSMIGGRLDPLHPKGRVNAFLKAKGPVFVNPGYARADGDQIPSPAEMAALRGGTSMNGGLVMQDRPIWLRLRVPQLSLARAMEALIDQRYASDATAKTQDEGVVQCYLPRQFKGDWEHFAGVVTHLYLRGVGAAKARELADEALKPDALLQDISYCWEGIGGDALPFVRPLYSNASPQVSFAAARAGAFIGDAAAEEALLQMAKADSHPFQLNAVKVLGGMNPSPRIDNMLAALLSVNNALVRVEAYRILAERESPVVLSKPVRGLFLLDRVVSDGPPLVYASRSGVPRIALFGEPLTLKMPVIFSAMNSKLTFSTTADGRSVVVFDRTDPQNPAGVQTRSSPDLLELVYRLGGGGSDGLRMTYAELVGILQKLSEEQKISAAFVLQDVPVMEDAIDDAPPIIEPDGNPPADLDSADTALPADVRVQSGVSR